MPLLGVRAFWEWFCPEEFREVGKELVLALVESFRPVARRMRFVTVTTVGFERELDVDDE